MPLQWKIYADLLTGDGVPDDDLSAYWQGINLRQGFREEDQHIADTGECMILLKNTDKRFSPDNASGPYYGNLIGGRAVKVAVINDGGSEITQFRGVVERNGWKPAAGATAGPFNCTLKVVDLMRSLQESDVTVALMSDLTTDTVVKFVTNAAFKSSIASGYIEFIGPVNDADTVSIAEATVWGSPFDAGTSLGVQTYTFKTALTGSANEILIETDSDGSDITPENLAAAINHDEGEGSAYGTGTNRNAGFSATYRARMGIDAADQDNWIPLRDTGSGYDKLSTSFILETDKLSTDVVWLYLRKQGSPTGTATVKVIMNERGLPNDTQFGTVTGTFAESSVSGSGAWLRVTLSDYIQFNLYQRYHIELSTDRAAHATNYIEWGDDTGANNYNAENTSGTWTSLGNSFVWCIPGRVELKARWRGTLFNYLKFTSSNSTDLYWSGQGVSPQPPNITGGTDAPSGLTSFAADTDTLQYIGDMWRTDIKARDALRDAVESSRSYLYCAEDGTITYKKRAWPFEAIVDTPAITLDNEQNATILERGKQLINQVKVEFTERREAAGITIARAGGDIEIPPNVKETADDYETENGTESKEQHGLRFNPNDDVEWQTTLLPFVNDDNGWITGATDVIQPVPVTDFTLWTEPNGTGRDATFLAQTRGGGMKIPTAITANGVEVTPRSTTGITSLYLHELKVRGTGLITRNPETVEYKDDTSIADHGVKQPPTIRLPSLTQFGRELALSLARYKVDRSKDEREYIGAVGFRGQTTAAGVKLYSVVIGDTVTISEDQTAISAQKSLVIGRRIVDTKNKSEPSLTWILRPLSDTPYWMIGNATYGDLPARMAI